MWMQQEFSTYIAHEKAQDAYLIEQMLQNLEETDEIADSTSLISAEMIEQLNQYTASELYEGQGRLHEENTGPLPMNQRDTGPMEYAQEWSHLEVDTSTQDIPSQGILPQDTAFQETAPPQGLQPPITNDQPPTRRVSAEIFQDMQQRGFELPQSVEHLSYTQGNLSSPAPYPEVRSPQEIARQAQEDQMLENLLEESFEDDESGLIESPDLDQILSLSINQGGRSPLVQSQLARPVPSLGFPASPPASTSFGLPTPPNTTPAPPASTSFGFPTPPPAPPASTSFGLPTPPNTTPALAPAIGAPYAEVPPSPSDRFSQDDLTPPPRRRPLKSPAPHSQSNIFKGLAALIVLCLLGVGISSVLSPAERLIRVQVFPPQGATIQVGPLPLQPVSTELQISLSSAELITVRHPEFTQWQKEVDPAQLKEPYLLKIDLEETAPRVSLSVKSKTRGAEVWIFGRLRGTTPFTEDVPTNLRGEIPIEVRVPGKPPWKQLKKVGKDSMKAYAPL